MYKDFCVSLATNIMNIMKALLSIHFDIYFRESMDTMQKKFVVRQLSRYIRTRRIQSPFQHIYVLSFQILRALFAIPIALSRA